MVRFVKCKPGGVNFELVTFNNDDIPPYAILSHTWTEGQEVTYDELVAGGGTSKDGYAKLRFCQERAAHDKLDYFWIDTCCIIQTHHRRQCPTKRVAYAAESGREYTQVFNIKVVLFLFT